MGKTLMPRQSDDPRYIDGGFDDAEAERMAREYAEDLGDWLYERKRDREMEDQMEGRKE
jgi:hypothetical protein